MAGLSPVTGILEEEKVILDFGDYEGKTVRELSELDRAFYTYLAQEKENGLFSIRRLQNKTFRLIQTPLARPEF